jgi:predicted dehydrogenase
MKSESSALFSAAIVGLGQVGSRFEEERSRIAIATHAGAYLALPHLFKICAGVEPSKANAEAFHRRCPDVPIYETAEDMLRQHKPDVISICTPTENHSAAVAKALESRDVRLIWCEKPLALDIEDAVRITENCRARRVPLMVTFNRRLAPIWQRARALIGEGAVGSIRSIRVAMPNRLFSIGSHAADLALFLGGSIEDISMMLLPALEEGGEPAISALLRYSSGAGGVIQVTGLKAQLIVEAEVIGDDGRLTVREDLETIIVERFGPSPRYHGYRQLREETRETVRQQSSFSPFVAMAENGAAHLSRGTPLLCDGSMGLEVQRILERMQRASDVKAMHSASETWAR